MDSQDLPETDLNQTIVTIEVPSQQTIADSPTARQPKDLLHTINLAPERRSAAAQIAPYSVHSTHRYLQPYPLNVTPPTPTIRHRSAPKLPWLECGGGLAAFSIISGVVAIDGMKQSPTVRPTTAQQTRPAISRLPNNPTSLPQVSTSELLNSGRTLPVPVGAMNPPQVAMNPTQNPTGPKLNLGTIEMNSIVIPKNLSPQSSIPPEVAIAQPPVAPRRKAIAPPETTPLPQPSVQKSPQPIPEPVPQPVLQQPALPPQATQTSEIPPSQAMPPAQDPGFLEPQPTPNTPTPPLQNEVSPKILKPIRSSTFAEPSPNGTVILEANPQSAVSLTPDDTLRLEVSKL